MSDTVKLIIELPKWEYEQACKFKDRDFYAIKAKAIQNGIPLDSVKAEIDTNLSWSMFDENGNETRLHKDLMEILDNIGKAESEDKE